MNRHEVRVDVNNVDHVDLEKAPGQDIGGSIAARWGCVGLVAHTGKAAVEFETNGVGADAAPGYNAHGLSHKPHPTLSVLPSR